MYAFKFLCRTNRLILNNCKKSTSHLINHERAVARKNFCSRFDIRRETENDVLLFEYDRTYQFLGLNVLAISQFIFWSYLGRFLYRDVKNTEIDMKSKFWNWLYSKERKYSTGLSIAVVVCGKLNIKRLIYN